MEENKNLDRWTISIEEVLYSYELMALIESRGYATTNELKNTKKSLYLNFKRLATGDWQVGLFQSAHYLQISDWQAIELLTGVSHTRRLIGYRLVKEDYGSAARSIIQNKRVSRVTDEKIILTNQKHSIAALEEAGVLDLWYEPFYEELEKVMTIGNPRVVVTVRKDTISCEGKYMKAESIERLRLVTMECNMFGLKAMKEHGNKIPWNMEITSIKIGCSVIKLEEIKEVLNEYDKLNGR